MRDLNPRELVGPAAPTIGGVGGGGIAVELLPHLIEPVDRARRVGVIREGFGIGELERSRRKMARILAVVQDARIRYPAWLAGAAGQHVFIIPVVQSVLERFDLGDIRRADARCSGRDAKHLATVRS